MTNKQEERKYCNHLKNECFCCGNNECALFGEKHSHPTPPENWEELIGELLNRKATPADLMNAIDQAILSAEDNMRKRCIEALPKKILDKRGEGFYEIEGWNDAIDEATQNINNLDKE